MHISPSYVYGEIVCREKKRLRDSKKIFGDTQESGFKFIVSQLSFMFLRWWRKGGWWVEEEGMKVVRNEKQICILMMLCQ